MPSINLSPAEAQLLSCALGIVEATKTISESIDDEVVAQFEGIRDELEVQYNQLAVAIPGVAILQVSLERIANEG